MSVDARTGGGGRADVEGAGSVEVGAGVEVDAGAAEVEEDGPSDP